MVSSNGHRVNLEFLESFLKQFYKLKEKGILRLRKKRDNFKSLRFKNKRESQLYQKKGNF